MSKLSISTISEDVRMELLKKGVWPTMITPYNKDGSVDFGAIRGIVDWYRSNGVSGIFSVCQSSEMFYLTLEERLKIAEAVTQAAGEDMDVIASGHISDDFASQKTELTEMAKTGVKAVVLVSNRFADVDENDEIWIERADELISKMPDIALGIYECPYPYKRLLSEKILRWMAGTNRFTFIKDTCCDLKLMQARIALLGELGGQIGLYNANSATALEALRSGAAGFSGVMTNFHADLYVWLCAHWQDEPVKAEKVQALLTAMSMYESFYPGNAKYHMNLVGIPMQISSRTPGREALTVLQKDMTHQIMTIEEIARQIIGV